MTQTVIGQTTGTIEVAGDNDWFKVSLSAGTEYVFSLGSSGTLGSSGSLALYDSSGNLVSTVTQGSQIVFEATTSGTYYVAASGVGGATGTYTLTESTTSFDYAGTTATTGTLSVGGSTTGTLTTAGQSDWFKVTLTAGSSYLFNLTSTALTGGQVSIYDANGNLITTGNANDTLAGNALLYTALTTGTYYIGASDTQNGLGAFTVSASNATVDFAGNVNTTGTVSVGGSVSGNLTNIGQRDWFKVTLTAGTEYVLKASSSGALIPSVTLYDSTGKALITGYGGGTNGGAETSFEPTSSGTYYIAAGGVASSIGAFTVSVSTATPDVLGTTATTGTVSVGGTASGTIATPGQSDWYKVTLTAGGKYALTAGSGTLSATVTLYDASGNALISGSGATFYEPTTSGTYYVGASGSGSATGTYTIGVTSTTVDYAGTTATTGTIAAGGSISGNLAHAGQSDWFKVTLTQGTNYEASLGGGLTNGDVTLYDSTGKAVTTEGNGNLAFSPTASGTYYLGVSSSTNNTGTFTLSLATYSDDYSSTTSTTGTLTGTLTAAAAIADNTAGTLPTGSTVVDSAANIQSHLDALETLAASGKVTNISLTDTSTPTITVTASQIATDAATLKEISSAFTLSITGYSSAVSTFVQNEKFAYIPGTSHSGSDQVIEISSVAAGAAAISLGSGFNAVIIDGVHSTTASTSGVDSFSFSVQANGTVTLLDNNTGKTETISGDTYLIFDGGATNSDGSFQSIYFIAGSVAAQVTSLYNAAFLRQPDLGGLEFYVKPITAGSFDLHQAAIYFLNSPEFAADYPTASLPSDNGGPNDTAFIETLYNNVLHRTPSASEVSFYTTALASGNYDRATLLEFFALSPENQANVSNLIINTTNGAYADSTTLLSASTVLSQVSSSSALNLSAISASSIGTGVSQNGITIASNDAVTLTSSAPTESVYLSSTFNTITVQNSGSTIYDAAGGSTITLSGATSTTLTVTNGGGSDVLNLTGGTATTINGFVAGSGTTLNITGVTNSANIDVLNGATTKVLGSSLTFGAGTAYVVEIGTVSDHTATTAATAIAAAYTATGASNEVVTFLAQDSSGNTLVWSYTAPSGGNSSHTITASELVNIATIVGVAPSALTAGDLA